MAKSNDTQRILEKLDSLETKLDEVRVKIIPTLDKKLAVVEERSSSKATIITGVGATITLVVTIGTAYALSLLQ